MFVVWEIGEVCELVVGTPETYVVWEIRESGELIVRTI